MMKSVSKALVLSIALGSMYSCSKLDDMGKNAVKASENSGVAAKAAGESREEIANSRVLQRSGGASESRREALLSLKDDMETLEMKITEASKYVKAFEFQTWTGQKYDTLEYLDALKEDAMEEFFRSLVEVNGDQTIEKSEFTLFKIIGSTEHTLNVYALALAIHGEHNVQKLITMPREETLKETNTIYSLIKEALLRIKKVEEGKLSFYDLKEYEQTVYNYKNASIALLQARYNALLTLAIARLSPVKDSKVAGLKALLLKKPFESRFQSLNIGEQFVANVYLDGAIKVQSFLKEIGVETQMIAQVEKLYGKMIVKSETTNDGGVIIASTLKAENTKYLANLKELFNFNNDRLESK